MNLSNLPYQAAIPVFKDDGERWTVGWNVFKDGIKVYYQSFFKLGGAPSKGRLASSGDYFGASSAVELTATGTTAVTAKVPAYPWLTCSAIPILTKFDLAITRGEITSNPASLSPQIAKTTTFINESPESVPYNPAVTYTYKESQKTTITDAHTYEAGIALEWKGEVNWFVAKSSLTVKLNFKYGYEHSTTTEDSTEKSFELTENVSVIVPPGETRYVSLILYGDVGATASVAIDYRLSGAINGERCTGAYLSQLVSARPGGTVLEKGDYYVLYRETGSIHASVVAETKIVVTAGLNGSDVEAILAEANKKPKD
jgi:hypothetical protein